MLIHHCSLIAECLVNNNNENDNNIIITIIINITTVLLLLLLFKKAETLSHQRRCRGTLHRLTTTKTHHECCNVILSAVHETRQQLTVSREQGRGEQHDSTNSRTGLLRPKREKIDLKDTAKKMNKNTKKYKGGDALGC